MKTEQRIIPAVTQEDVESVKKQIGRGCTVERLLVRGDFYAPCEILQGYIYRVTENFKAHRIGDRVRVTGYESILVLLGGQRVCAVNLDNGVAWWFPIEVEDTLEITYEEMCTICGGADWSDMP